MSEVQTTSWLVLCIDPESMATFGRFFLVNDPHAYSTATVELKYDESHNDFVEFPCQEVLGTLFVFPNPWRNFIPLLLVYSYWNIHARKLDIIVHEQMKFFEESVTLFASRLDVE